MASCSPAADQQSGLGLTRQPLKRLYAAAAGALIKLNSVKLDYHAENKQNRPGVCRPVLHQEVSLLCCLEECWELFALSAPSSARLSFAVSGCAHSHLKPVFFPPASFFSFTPPASYFTLHTVKKKKAQWRWCYCCSPLPLNSICEAFGRRWQSCLLTFALSNAQQTLAWSGWPGR